MEGTSPKTVSKIQDYRDFLLAELKQRKLKNRYYSMRAFCRDIGVSPSNFSPMLKGQKRLTIKCANQIAQRLRWNAKKSLYLQCLVALQEVETEEVQSVFREIIQREFQDLTSEQQKEREGI